MKLRRVVVLSLTGLLLAAVLWIVAGNAWAARREARCEREWDASFGSFDDMRKKYPKRETNEIAKRLAALGEPLGFDLTPSPRGSNPPARPHPTDDARRGQSIGEYVAAELGKAEAVVDAPPPDVVRFFEEKCAHLDAVEALLISGPPQWSFDPSVPESEHPVPDASGEIRLQKLLMARALAEAQAGHHDAAAHTLEASWSLNGSLQGRPEMIPSLLGIALARLQAGVLRRVNVEEGLWRERLASLDPRSALLAALDLSHRANSGRNWWTAVVNDTDQSGFQRVRSFLGRPLFRVAMADYSDLVRLEFAQLRGAPLSDHFPAPRNPEAGNLARIIANVQMPNIKNAFLRADRLVVDAELTSKILEAKRLRREHEGRWPAAIPGIEASRYPNASWRYEVSPEGRMSLEFSRELASPYPKNGSSTIPLRFSSY